MDEAILNKAQRIYAEARGMVAEEVALKKKSSQHIVRLANLLTGLYEIFLRREDQNERLVLVPKKQGFADFREARSDLLPRGCFQRDHLRIAARALQAGIDIVGPHLEPLDVIRLAAQAGDGEIERGGWR